MVLILSEVLPLLQSASPSCLVAMVTAAKPVQPIAGFSPAAWFHEAAEITDVVGKPSPFYFLVPPPLPLALQPHLSKPWS